VSLQDDLAEVLVAIGLLNLGRPAAEVHGLATPSGILLNCWRRQAGGLVTGLCVVILI